MSNTGLLFAVTTTWWPPASTSMCAGTLPWSLSSTVTDAPGGVSIVIVPTAFFSETLTEIGLLLRFERSTVANSGA